MTGNGNEPDTTHANVGQFDDIDETILRMLEEDGRATLSQLSDATGLSISAVQSRVQKLGTSRCDSRLQGRHRR